MILGNQTSWEKESVVSFIAEHDQRKAADREARLLGLTSVKFQEEKAVVLALVLALVPESTVGMPAILLLSDGTL